MNVPQLRTNAFRWLRWTVQTGHRRLLWCGGLAGLVYLPILLGHWAVITSHGSSDPILNVGLIFLALSAIWNERQRWQQWQAQEEDRWLGYLLLLGSTALFPFFFQTISIQALLVALILVGSALSTWGLVFLRRFPLPMVMLMLSCYPDLGFFGVSFWRVLTPANLLENVTAWAGSLGLRAIGQAAIVQGALVTLPKGSVLVGPGCNGFSMAFTLACCSALLGLFFKWRWSRTLGLMAFSVALSLLLNVPRVMLLAIASVYWGKESFEFWHGPWGGQMFAIVLFTLYYYVVMALLKKQPTRQTE
jgi:exosortase